MEVCLSCDCNVKGVVSLVLLIFEVVKEIMQEFETYHEDFKVIREEEKGDEEAR